MDIPTWKQSQAYVEGSERLAGVLQNSAQSPNLNPIENLWKELGHQIGSRNHSNRADLLQHLQEEWAKMPSDFLEKLIESMSWRCEAVIAAKLKIEVKHGIYYSYLLNIHHKQDVFLH